MSSFFAALGKYHVMMWWNRWYHFNQISKGALLIKVHVIYFRYKVHSVITFQDQGIFYVINQVYIHIFKHPITFSTSIKNNGSDSYISYRDEHKSWKNKHESSKDKQGVILVSSVSSFSVLLGKCHVMMRWNRWYHFHDISRGALLIKVHSI